MALAQHGIGWLGGRRRQGDHGPFRRSPKNGWFAGETPKGRGSVPFGGRNGHIWLASRRAKYCHNEGMALAPHQAVATEIADERRATPEGP